MKLTLTLFLIFPIISGNAQSLDSISLNGTVLSYHKVDSKVKHKKGLLIFMHGGVSPFEKLENPVVVPIPDLLEHNGAFIPVFSDYGYDVILPIAFREFNWLNQAGEEFIKALLSKYSGSYPKTLLAGFSDGGTGAYRFFYTKPGLFDGVLIFNGYPQLNNFSKQVDYSKVTVKPVIYASTFSDKRIPYEFLMIEYRRQKMVNPHTYLSIVKGGHSFASYTKQHFEKYLNVLHPDPVPAERGTDSVWVYPPVDGWLENDVIAELYPFRKKYGKQYGMSEEEYQRSDYEFKGWNKLWSKGFKISVKPSRIPKADLRSLKTIRFRMFIDGEEKTLHLTNWLRM